MRELVIQGWRVGFDKIKLTKVLRAEFGMSLLEGKSITDKVLDNEQVRISLDDHALDEEQFLSCLRAIGVEAWISV